MNGLMVNTEFTFAAVRFKENRSCGALPLAPMVMSQTGGYHMTAWVMQTEAKIRPLERRKAIPNSLGKERQEK